MLKTKSKTNASGIRTIAAIAFVFLINAVLPLMAAGPVVVASHPAASGATFALLSLL